MYYFLELSLRVLGFWGFYLELSPFIFSFPSLLQLDLKTFSLKIQSLYNPEHWALWGVQRTPGFMIYKMKELRWSHINCLSVCVTINNLEIKLFLFFFSFPWFRNFLKSCWFTWYYVLAFNSVFTSFFKWCYLKTCTHILESLASDFLFPWINIIMATSFFKFKSSLSEFYSS